ncbi:MAG: T9SS type A sorting domain-containing protein [Rhizobacter sp.]|nr:T9SS type A sorting domain-containing protein [Ferruginibacter sp.]
MKSTLIVLLLLFSAGNVSAQLTITAGAQFSVNGNMQLTLENADLFNDGSFSAGNGTTSFTGNLTSHIVGSQQIEFNQLEVNKTGLAVLLLRRDISVTQRIFFSSGFFILGGRKIDLGTTGFIANERDSSRIADVADGEVLFNVNLDAPVAANPANLGLFITSNQNLGNVTIKRRHYFDADNTGAAVSILRYYDILPAVNNNLDATLKFTYFDSELNGFNENTLSLFQRLANQSRVDLGFTSRDGVANFVEKTGMGSLGKFTLSDARGMLPVHFILSDTKCETGTVLLNWTTAREVNSRDFNIERSIDGNNWVIIGSMPAAGNSSIERSYSFTDRNPLPRGLYRIAAHNLNGSIQYTDIHSSPCNTNGLFIVWPNPVHDVLFINLSATNQSPAVIKLFDSKGALVKIQRPAILPGSNQLRVDMRSLAAGIYALSLDWENGRMKKIVKIVRQ